MKRLVLSSFLLAASYRDKYGPLGTIAVLAGRQQGEVAVVEVWAASCRAFSRRIEHRCLERLFDRFGADAIWIRGVDDATGLPQLASDLLERRRAGELKPRIPSTPL